MNSSSNAGCLAASVVLNDPEGRSALSGGVIPRQVGGGVADGVEVGPRLGLVFLCRGPESDRYSSCRRYCPPSGRPESPVSRL